MSLTDRLEAYLRERPNQWVDARALLSVAGFGGWRTRLSDLRRQRGLCIENKQDRVLVGDDCDCQGVWIRRSYYRYVPAEPQP